MTRLHSLKQLLRQTPEYQAVLRRAVAARPDGAAPISLGAIEAARAVVAAALTEDLSGNGLLLANSDERARQFLEELAFWFEGELLLFPAPEALPLERIPWSQETIRERVRVLASLVRQPSQRRIVVASVQSLLTPLPAPEQLRGRLLMVRPGYQIALSDLTRYLVDNGYQQATVVEVPGTFSRRGGIVDVFPATASSPVRVEFFGDLVDSLRSFDPESQLSTGMVDHVLLSPANEAVAGLGPWSVAAMARLDLEGCHTAARADFERDREMLEQGQLPQAFGLYLGYLYERACSLLDYLGPNGIVLIDDLDLTDAAAEEYWDQAQEAQARGMLGGDLPTGMAPALLEWQALRERLLDVRAHNLGMGGAPEEDEAGSLRGVFVPQLRLGGQVKAALDRFREAAAKGAALVISRQAQRFSELLAEQGVAATMSSAEESGPSLPLRGIYLLDDVYPEGWTLRLPDGYEVAVFTDTDIFGWKRPVRRPPVRRARNEAFISEVQPGEYVVHIEHGIGRYLALRRLVRDGVEREYLEIEYAGGDRLFVPSYQVDRVSRYVGAGDAPPALTRLGAADWREAKARAGRAVQAIADDLLDLYAARLVASGYSFKEDDGWQHELEASFPYEETEDQLRAIAAVKGDMEEPRPMDRLISGDVGYGKTEVALRAAFKAVMNGKQVAVLVPTTVLAQQHYDTFTRRLAPFPVSVEMLSRFRSEREQRDIIARLIQGDVDIVIGTHRLLQPDVLFKDLGLVIIDEEQRFGVRHKEALKQLRKEVDVLTMTATPIPRTLYMAITGLRDMSSIDTPPEDRLPVWTYVAQWDDSLVQRAIRRELARGGQVFLVHDRVRGIESLRSRISRLVPEARVGVGHGQLPERELSSVMERFAAGEVDVLICTTIIESGLDIPNANTIIINHADRFGLAQLYQLRGRVGRGAARAYAYLLHSPGQGLSEVARQRLRAIMEASELGSGLQIAMRDLEIRGAGDILGRRQHGHISAVGFDLYTRLLAQAVAERRAALGDAAAVQGSELEAFLRPLQPSLQINLPLQSEFPESYIPDAALRLALYRRLAASRDIGEVDEFEKELRDRFGPPPPVVETLLYQARVKVVAESLGATAIGKEDGQFYVRMDVSWLEGRHLQELLGGYGRLGRGQVWLTPPDDRDWRRFLLWALREILAHKREVRPAAPLARVRSHHRSHPRYEEGLEPDPAVM